MRLKYCKLLLTHSRAVSVDVKLPMFDIIFEFKHCLSIAG